MKPEAMAEALDAIHDEAVKLLGMSPSDEISQGLHLIVSLARYRFDVRSATESGGDPSGTPGESPVFEDD